MALHRFACKRDLEGVVAKWARGTDQSGAGTSWLKIKNPDYSQMEGRHELFESRKPEGPRRLRSMKPSLVLASSRAVWPLRNGTTVRVWPSRAQTLSAK